MYRYFVMVWAPEDRRAAESARLIARLLNLRQPQWICVLDREGVTAFHAGVRAGSSEATRIDGGAGVVFGKLFGHNGSSANLVESRWGRYVAVIFDPATCEARILRDPTGALPCFHGVRDGVNLFFSDLETVLSLGFIEPSINWRYVAASVAYSALQVRATGLNEISEVQAGECVILRGGSVRRSFAWNPVAVAQRDPIEDVGLAVRSLRETTRACVQAWAASYQGLIHNLSGGLDSSIVLSCLQDAPACPPLVCLHYFVSGRDEDERRYARLAAERAGVKLIECELDPANLRLETILKIRRSPKPWYYLHEIERSEIENRLAAEHGATGLISGAGGDSLFYQSRADLAVADHLYRHALHPRLFGIALDAARIARASVWAMLHAAFRNRLSRKRWNPLAEVGQHRTVINPEIVESVRADESLLHPWFSAAQCLAPGKLWHIVSLSIAPAFYDSFGREEAPERTLPLMSQPLIELCLRTPTYLSTVGGRDRSIARRAFADDMPIEIIRRRAKGAIDHYSRRILDRNLAFVREMLLDGLLVRERILDRRQLELQLSRERSPADFEYNEILNQHLCTEVWLRRMTARSPIFADLGA